MKRRKKPKTATTHKQEPSSFRSIILACLIFYLTISSALAGQRPKPKPADYALIFGTVWGPDDQPAYGVKVKIRPAGEKKARWEVYSNRLGEFEQRVPAGRRDYVIWADLKGFKSPHYKHLQPGPEVTVHIESDERADTGLHLK